MITGHIHEWQFMDNLKISNFVNHRENHIMALGKCRP